MCLTLWPESHTPTKQGNDNKCMRDKNNMNKLERDHLAKRVRMISVSALARKVTSSQATGSRTACILFVVGAETCVLCADENLLKKL